MKKETFKQNEMIFLECPKCGKTQYISAYGLWTYEKKKYKCSACKTAFNFYLNQIGKAFTEERNRVRCIGYIYKVL